MKKDLDKEKQFEVIVASEDILEEELNNILGEYADPEDPGCNKCKKLIGCNGYFPTHCPEPLVWDETLQQCVFPN